MPVLGTLAPVENARRLLGDAMPCAAVTGEARLSWRRWRQRGRKRSRDLLLLSRLAYF